MKSSPLFALLFFAFGDVLSEDFLQGAEDQLAMESHQYQTAEVADIPNYRQKALKGLQEDRMHKRNSEQTKEGPNWKTDAGQNGILGQTKSEFNGSRHIPFRKLDQVNGRNLNSKNGYEIYSFMDGKGANKLINEGKEEKYQFDPQKIFTEIKSSGSSTKSDVVPHILRKRLSSNVYNHPVNFKEKPLVLRGRQRSYPLNPKTALNSQSISVLVLPPDPNYSANILNPQSQLASHNINKVSSYVDYNLPAPIFRNIMNENGQLVQQYIDAKPIPHNSIQHYQHSTIKQNYLGPANQPILHHQHHQLNNGNHGITQSSQKSVGSSNKKNYEPSYDNKKNLNKKMHNVKNSQQKLHKIHHSPESSYLKISSNPSKYQQSYNTDDKEEPKFNKRVNENQEHNNNFRKGEQNLDSHNSQEHPSEHYDNNSEHEQTDEPITRGPDYANSEEDSDSRNHNHHAEQEHLTDEDSTNPHSQESNDYEDDTPNENDHENHPHNQEESSPTHEKREKYEPNEEEQEEEGPSSQEVGNSYDDPNSSEDNLHKDQNPNSHQHESSDKVPTHLEKLNKFFYGKEKDENEGGVKFKNQVDQEEIENDKKAYHNMKHTNNIDDHNNNHDKSHFAEPHQSNHNFIVRHNNNNRENLNHNRNQLSHISSQSNNVHSSNGKPNDLNQHSKYYVPVIDVKNNNHYSHHKNAQHPQNYVHKGPHLYQLNGVVGNKILVHRNNVPRQQLYLPNNQVYNIKPQIVSGQRHSNNGFYENNANGIPHHILLKQSNVPLTFHHSHPITGHGNSDQSKPNIPHGPNYVNSISNKNIYNEYDPKEKNSEKRGNIYSSGEQVTNDQYNNDNNNEEDNNLHYRHKKEPLIIKANRQYHGKHNDGKYKEETFVNEEEKTPPYRHSSDEESSNEESNPNIPLEEENRHTEEEVSSTEEDDRISHSHDDDERYQDVVSPSNADEVPDHQRANNKDRTKYNDDASSNEEESPVQQQSKDDEILNTDDEPSSHEIENTNHQDNDEESTGNDDVVVENNDEEDDSEVDQQPQDDRNKDDRYVKKLRSSDEEERESDEQLSQEEKKGLFKKHFENEFGINPAKSKNNKRMQNLHKLRPETAYRLQLNEDFSDNRRSFNVDDKKHHIPLNSIVNKFVNASPVRPHEEMNSKEFQKFGFQLESQSQDGKVESRQLSKANSENNQTLKPLSKVKIPQFESFGDFFLN